MARVFLVEDNAADVDLFRMALDMAQVECELRVFCDGEAIIKHMRSQGATGEEGLPDLVVLDLNLPKYDGPEVLAVSRQAPAFASVPFLVLSSTPSVRERQSFGGCDMVDFLIKPADLDQYLAIGETVGRALKDIQKRRETETMRVRDGGS